MTDSETLEELKEEKLNFKQVLNEKKLNKFELDRLMAEA